MTRTLTAILVSSFLFAGPALADEAGKSKTETVTPSGTKVSVKKKKEIKDDGTGEVKTEVATENPNTGVETTKRTKVSREKNADGTMTTKTKKETETKN
jgi:hypothetical protein